MSDLMTSGLAPTSARDGDFDALIAAIQRRFTASVAGERVPLFLTDTPDLFATFLDALHPELRPSYTCSACRTFVRRYGGLVRLTPAGDATSVLWDPADAAEPYVAAIAALASAVSRAPLKGVFLASERVWGQPVTGAWHHFAVTPPDALVFKPSPVQTRAQVVAEQLEDRAILQRGLAEFPAALVINAHTLLSTGALYRSEKCIGVAAWLMDLHARLASEPSDRRRDNLTWHAVATAPPGYCHVRSTMIGTLLEDLAAGLPFESIRSRFAGKMDPLQYQRPTAPPSAGNIAQAEKIVAGLRSAGALERRFARLEDIVPLWTPRGPDRPDAPAGVFSHLKPKGSPPAAVEAPAITMTWDKFARTVLPTAEAIEYLVPASKQPYLGMVTAKHPDAPPIVQWDSEKQRNPVTWYVYHGGSPPAQWNLVAGVYHPVTAVTLAPWAWHATDARKSAHQGEKVVLILAGARDTTYQKGAGFFPEFLKSEYHAIRSTMEAYARDAVIDGKDDASACGIVLQKGSTWNYTVRVTSKGGVRVSYTLDRWD